MDKEENVAWPCKYVDEKDIMNSLPMNPERLYFGGSYEPFVGVWIRVSVRLPQPDVRVLIFGEDGIATASYRYDCWDLEPHQSYAGDGCTFNVTHWMPLPEAPTDE